MKINPAFTGAMSGSAGGTTASRNRYGQYLRRRSAPVNPRTDRQQVQRGYFAAAANTWAELTPDQRKAWNTYAANTPRLDSLGNTVMLTGQVAFIGASTLAQRANTAGATPQLSALNAPTIFNQGNPVTHANPILMTSTPSVSYNIAGDISPSAGGASADGIVLIFQGRPQNDSRTFYKGPYQFVGVSSTIAATDPGFAAPSILTLPYGGILNTTYPMRYVVLYADARHPIAFEVFAEIQPSV